MKPNSVIKFIIFIILAVFLKLELKAQGFKGLDKVPLDISYYRMSRVSKPLVKVIYGRPQKNGQKVFGNLVVYGKLWKTGANEATEIKFYQDVLFGDVKVSAGTYVLVTIPGEKEWEIILSSNLDVWGAYQYDSLFDIAKITVPSSKAEEINIFSIAFKQKKGAVQMVLAWDSTRVNIPISFEINEALAKL
jgi:hypothetical protein